MKLLITIFFLIISSAIFADEEALKKYKDYTPEQIKELPEKERSSSLPMMFTFAARRGLSPDSKLLFGMELNTLMYPGLHDYENAIKAFQKDLGDKPTGILTVWQIHNLQQRSEMQKLSTVLFPDQYSSFKTKDIAQVNGTMMIHDERIAWPVNHTKLSCYKADKYCELNQIYLDFPDENSWSQNFHVMQASTEIYNITNWSEHIVDAVPNDPGNGCRTTALNLNFKTKEFYQITRNGTSKCEALGVTFPKLKKPRIAQIVDGKEIIQSEFNSLKKKTYNVLSSSFREKVDKIIRESEKVTK